MLSSILPFPGRQNASTVLAYFAVGVLLGWAVNKLNKFLDKHVQGPYEVSPVLGVLLKVIPVTLGMMLFQMLTPGFSTDWTKTVPGLFFVTFYFGMQLSLMEDLARMA